MNIVLFDDPKYRDQLLPLTFTRPVSECRVGILKISEKWKHYLPEAEHISFYAHPSLTAMFPTVIGEDNILINGAVLPDENLVREISNLKLNEALSYNGDIIAARGSKKLLDSFSIDLSSKVELQTLDILAHPWDIFQLNSKELKKDFLLLTKGRKSLPIKDPFTKVYSPENVFIEEGATIRAAIINASNGPVYIGKNALIEEGSFINGSFALCDNAVLKPLSILRGDTTIGPYSKVGGEISNSVIFGYSNKAHDGYLGNSVLGEWCNLGAGTTTSNMKNNYSEVKLWDYSSVTLKGTGQQFCGLIMGDHSKTGISTIFNTGTVVGVSSNIFGAGFPSKFIPSFSWGGADRFVPYKMEKAVSVAEIMKGRRNMQFSNDEITLFEEIEKEELKYRAKK